MTVINAILNRTFDLLLAPFAGTSPWPGMIVVSALAGILILLIFKYTSNQNTLKRKKNRALARILEFLLFKDDLIVTLGAFNRVMVANVKYLGQVLIPLGVSLVPLVLVLVQLNAWFSVRALQQDSYFFVGVTGNEANIEVRRQPGNFQWVHPATEVGRRDGISRCNLVYGLLHTFSQCSLQFDVLDPPGGAFPTVRQVATNVPFGPFTTRRRNHCSNALANL